MKLTEDDIRQAITMHPLSMADAARYLNVPFGTFKYAACKFGLYNPNQSHKGRSIPTKGTGYNLNDILTGKIIYKGPSQNIKHRMLAAGLKQDVCEACGITSEWNGKYLVLQLDHIDGNHSNWMFDNLRILCPNCHTQTDTYSGKNRTNKTQITECTDEQILEALRNATSMAEVARTLGLNEKSRSVITRIKQLKVNVHISVNELN